MHLTDQSFQSPLRRWACLRMELLWVWDGAVAPEAREVISDHRMGYWLWLLRKGSVEVQAGDRQWKAAAGEWIVSPQERTTQRFSKDARIMSLHFHCQWPTGENLFAGTGAEVCRSKDFPRMERSAAALCRIVQRHFPKVRVELPEKEIDLPVFLKVEQHFSQLLVDFYQMMTQAGRLPAQSGTRDERLSRVAQCLHDHPLAEPFPAEQLQRESALGRAQIDRLFWKEFGLTSREYWEGLRQEAAERALEGTSLSVKQIGYQIGFKQSSHFSKWFQHRKGIAPSFYRERFMTIKTG